MPFPLYNRHKKIINKEGTKRTIKKNSGKIRATSVEDKIRFVDIMCHFHTLFCHWIQNTSKKVTLCTLNFGYSFI